MTLRIKLARSADLRNRAYQLRFQVFEKEGYQFGAESIHQRRFVDFWDALETTCLFVVLSGDQLVSTMRGVVDSEIGIPAAPYDFAPFRAGLEPAKGVLLGRLATHPDFRGGGLAIRLQDATISYLKQIGVRYIFGLANTRYAKWWEDYGYRWIDEEMAGPGTSLKLRPHYIDLTWTDCRFGPHDYFGQARALRDSSEVAFLDAGEALDREADASCWELVKGAIELRDGDTAVGQLSPGAVIGADGPLSAAALTAVALEADTVLVGMDRRRFRELVASGEAPSPRLTGDVKR